MNTWSRRVFDAFAHGVDVTMQALTKYAGGHSDYCWGRFDARGDGVAAVGRYASTSGMRGFSGRLQSGAARAEDPGGAAEGN